MNQEPFAEEKPPKTWGEWKDKKKQQMSIAKDKASVKAAELKVKAKEKADRVDKESIKNKFGGFWKKIKREKDNEDGQEGKEQTGGKKREGKGMFDDDE